MLSRSLVFTLVVSSPLALASTGCTKRPTPAPVETTSFDMQNPAQRDPVEDDKKPGGVPQPGSVNAGGPAGEVPQGEITVDRPERLVPLFGAAAMAYLYEQHKASPETGGPDGRYHVDKKTGRLFYRDTERATHWIAPPIEGIVVPENEADQYRPYQGFNGSTRGREFTGLSRTED